MAVTKSQLMDLVYGEMIQDDIINARHDIFRRRQLQDQQTYNIPCFFMHTELHVS